MSLWQFYALVDGYIEANVPKDQRLKPPSSEEHDKALEWYKHARKHVGDKWGAVEPVGVIPPPGLARTESVLKQLMG